MRLNPQNICFAQVTPIPIALSNCTVNKGKKTRTRVQISKTNNFWLELPFSKITKIQDQIY